MKAPYANIGKEQRMQQPNDTTQPGAGDSRRRFLQQTVGASVAAAALPAVTHAAEGRKVRMAVVGGGFGAGFWWHEHPQCEVTAVTDLREDRRKNLIRRYKCQSAYESLEVMLEKAADTFDAVAVFSGAPEHVKHAVMCMKAGKHVCSAVPAAVTLEECAQLKETKEKTGLRYMMAESSYYRQACISAREMYEQGQFGDNLFYSEVEYYHPSIGDKSSGLSWFQGKPTWRYGFPPMLYPTHSTGFLVGVTKERLVEVSCLGVKDTGDFPAPNETRWKNPYVAEMALCKTDRGNMCRVGVFWNGVSHGERAQWFGDKVALYMRSSGGQPDMITAAGKGTKPWKIPEWWKTDRLPEKMRHASGHGGSAAFISAEFVDALVEDREPAIDLYESLAMTAPGIVAHQSALKGGEQLKVPSYDRKPA